MIQTALYLQTVYDHLTNLLEILKSVLDMIGGQS